MRSFRTYADALSVLDINQTCSGFAIFPDVPELLRAKPTADQIGSRPGVYPLELELEGQGETLRVTDSGTVYFNTPTRLLRARDVRELSCWRVVLLEAGERFERGAGVRHVMHVPLSNQAILYANTPWGVLDGNPPWSGIGPPSAGFYFHPYAESARFTFTMGAETIPEVKAQVWIFPQGGNSDVGPFERYGWTLWDEFPITEAVTYGRTDLPGGVQAVIMLDAVPAVDIIPGVEFTLRLP